MKRYSSVSGSRKIRSIRTIQAPCLADGNNDSKKAKPMKVNSMSAARMSIMRELSILQIVRYKLST